MSYLPHTRESLSPVRQVPTYGKPVSYVHPITRIPLDAPNRNYQVNNNNNSNNNNSNLANYSTPVLQSYSPTKYPQYQPQYQVSQNISLDDNEVGLWKRKYNELENSLCQVNSDLELANFRARKAKQYEEQIESLMRRNQQLLDENDAASKIASQKKSESQVWKSKYETQMNSSIGQRANYEREIHRLQEDVKNLRLNLDSRPLTVISNSPVRPTIVEKIVEIEVPVHQNRTGAIIVEEVESLQQSHINNVSLYEEQLRKLREIVEDREREIEELKIKVAHFKLEGDSQASRLAEERDKLRHTIGRLELAQQEQLELQKRKQDSHYNEQIKNINELHRSKINVLQDEMSKLRQLLELKNDEINTLILQNRGQKENFQDDNLDLRLEIQELKDTIRALTIQKDEQLRFQSENMSNLHSSEIQTLRTQYENQIYLLTTEINKLNDIINSKNQEIEIKCQENVQISNQHNDDKRRLQADIDKLLLRIESIERARDEALAEANIKMDRANFESNENLAQQTDHIRYLELQIENLKALIAQKNDDLQQQINNFETSKQILEHDVKSRDEEIKNLKLDINQNNQEFGIIIDDLKNTNARLTQTNNVKNADLTDRIIVLERERQITNEKLIENDEEIQQLSQLRERLEYQIRKLEDENHNQEVKINTIEQIQIQELEELRQQLEKNNNEIILSIQNTHQNQIDMASTREQDLKVLLNNQEKEIYDLFLQYENIAAAYAQGQPFTSELSAIKDIFEATAKSRLKNSGQK